MAVLLGAMDILKCKAKAARYRELARSTSDPAISDMLLDLAREWERRADRLLSQPFDH